MNKKNKILVFGIIVGVALLVLPHWSLAASASTSDNDLSLDTSTKSILSDTEGSVNNTDQGETVQAQVIKIIDEKEIKKDDGSTSKQQNLEIRILTGELAGRIEEYVGISEVQVVNSSAYKVGDKVIVNYSKNDAGDNVFYVIDYVRTGPLIFLVIFFVAVVLLVGRLKGLRALLSFFLSFLFIVYVMVPLLLHGWNAIAIGLMGSIAILVSIIYLTEGYNRKSHVAALGILFSLIFTAILSAIFVATNHLTGTASDEVTYLMGVVTHPLNYRNLLLAAMFVGILGILDDVVIGQVESVMQIKIANPELNNKKVFNMAFKVGQSHLGAIINTLFLAYISTALPLMLLISLHQQPFVSFSDVFNNEQVATEIVRILVGVIGLCSAIPISTWLAAKYLKVSSSDKLSH